MNFQEIATKRLADVERPSLPPIGTYRFRVTGLPEIAKSKDEKWDIVTFPVQAVEAQDVDANDLEEWLSQNGGDISRLRMYHKFMFNCEDESDFRRTEYNLRRFLEAHLRCADESMSLKEAINASVNAQFLAQITWRQDKNNKDIQHANLSRTAPLD